MLLLPPRLFWQIRQISCSIRRVSLFSGSLSVISSDCILFLGFIRIISSSSDFLFSPPSLWLVILFPQGLDQYYLYFTTSILYPWFNKRQGEPFYKISLSWFRLLSGFRNKRLFYKYFQCRLYSSGRVFCQSLNFYFNQTKCPLEVKIEFQWFPSIAPAYTRPFSTDKLKEKNKVKYVFICIALERFKMAYFVL